MQTYTGYIYIWFDTVAKLYYVGGHKGKVEDRYIASNKPLLRAYKIRPETFRFRVLEYVCGDNQDLRAKEQRWLDMIKDHELLLTRNVLARTHRYYNVKTQSSGGNGVGTNKGNSNIGGHNRKTWIAIDPDGQEHIILKSRQFEQLHKKLFSGLYTSYVRGGGPIKGGQWAGWSLNLAK